MAAAASCKSFVFFLGEGLPIAPAASPGTARSGRAVVRWVPAALVGKVAFLSPQRLETI